MKRREWLISMAAAVAVLVAGCGGAAQKPAAPSETAAPTAPVSNKLQAETGTTLEFEVITESMLPDSLAQWKEMQSLPKSTPSARVGDHLYVVVVGGTESIGASAIAAREVEFVEKQAAVIVKAMVTPGKAGAEIMTFPRSYIRIPYAASLPVPVVTTHIQIDKAAESPANPAAVVSNPPAPPSNPSSTDSTLAMTRLTASALPASLSAWSTSTVQVPGGVARYVDGALYLMVSGGQRNTGGYSVEIRSIAVSENVVRVSARLHSPNAGDMVTQAITYPKAFAKVELAGEGEPQVIVDWQK